MWWALSNFILFLHHCAIQFPGRVWHRGMGMSACTHLPSAGPCEQSGARAWVSAGCRTHAAEIYFPSNCHRDSRGTNSRMTRNYRPDHTTVIKLSSVNKTRFFQLKKKFAFFPLKKNIDVGGLWNFIWSSFCLLTFSFPVSFLSFFANSGDI